MNTIKMGNDFMVRVPKFRLCEVMDISDETLIHPAFIVGGKEVDEIYISKYQNIIIGGAAYSLSYQQPKTNINFDTAAQACRNKGNGWHLMTNAEWAAIALWCLKNGTLPHGNTQRGTHHADNAEKGIRYDDWRTLTGSGPATWAHDHTEDGIYDLCGNVFEWVSGVRVLNGELHIIPDNNAAIADSGKESEAWEKTGLKYFITDGKITLKEVGAEFRGVETDWGGAYFKNVQDDICALGLFQSLGLVPTQDAPKEGYFWVDNTGERLCYRGGYYNGYADAGVFCAYLYDARSTADGYLGFRSAFVNL